MSGIAGQAPSILIGEDVQRGFPFAADHSRSRVRSIGMHCAKRTLVVCTPARGLGDSTT